MTPSKRRRAAQAAYWQAGKPFRDAESVAAILAPGAWDPAQAGPTHAEKVAALKAIDKAAAALGRLAEMVMRLECDEVKR